jgi:hypothetical protein
MYLLFTVDLIIWQYNAGAHPEFFTGGAGVVTVRLYIIYV